MVETMLCMHTSIGSSPITSKNFMKYLKKKNIANRLSFRQQEHKKIILKAICYNKKLKTKTRWNTFSLLPLILSKNSFLTRIKNRCIITGRSKSIYTFFKISRIKLRELASVGALPGVSKYSL